MNKKKYLPRIAEKKLNLLLKTTGCVWIRGLKWSGKSTIALHFAKSSIMMQDPFLRESNKTKAWLNQYEFLNQPAPFLIDEWQEIDYIWDAIRMEVDKRAKFGQFIITGSQEPDKQKLKHTGIGRINSFLLRTMTLWETGDSNGKISLADLFNQEVNNDFTSSEKTYEEVIKLTIRGGWPIITQQKEEIDYEIAKNYTKNIISREFINFNLIDSMKSVWSSLLISLARNVASNASIYTIADDIKSSKKLIVSNPTIQKYIEVLENQYIIENLHTWKINLRSKTEIRKSPKRYFGDPSLPASLLKCNVQSLISDINTYGFLFENLCYRDLSVYVESLDGEIFYYQDKTGLEIDFVLVDKQGRFGFIEAKLGTPSEIEQATKNLLKLKNKINIKNSLYVEPSFMVILTAGQTAYKTKDGINVIPITCLKN